LAEAGGGRGGAAAADRAGRVGHAGGRVGGVAEGGDGAGDRVQAGQGAGRAAGLHRAVGLDPVGGRRRRRAGRGGAAGRADDVGRGRDLAGHGQGYAAEDPAGLVEAAQRDRGVLRLRERGGGDAHRQDGRRGGASEQNSPVIHEALHFDVVNSGDYGSAGDIDREANGGPFGGNLTHAGRTRPVCAPEMVTQLWPAA